jgi:mono/diheme cytochrome c family protein
MKHGKGSRTVTTVIVTIIVLIILAVAGGLAVIYTGIISVAATAPHMAVTRWVLSTAMDRSVEAHARSVKVPADYNNLSVQAGYFRYNDMCMPCHGAPGVERHWIGRGLLPEPPDLSVTAGDWTPAEVFWIIDHGIKMSGMPALAPTQAEDQIWLLAAFVKKLPGMTPDQYKGLGQK